MSSFTGITPLRPFAPINPNLSATSSNPHHFASQFDSVGRLKQLVALHPRDWYAADVAFAGKRDVTVGRTNPNIGTERHRLAKATAGGRGSQSPLGGHAVQTVIQTVAQTVAQTTVLGVDSCPKRFR